MAQAACIASRPIDAGSEYRSVAMSSGTCSIEGNGVAYANACAQPGRKCTGTSSPQRTLELST